MKYFVQLIVMLMVLSPLPALAGDNKNMSDDKSEEKAEDFWGAVRNSIELS